MGCTASVEAMNNNIIMLYTSRVCYNEIISNKKIVSFSRITGTCIFLGTKTNKVHRNIMTSGSTDLHEGHWCLH